jgi:hypothetical protein
MIHCSLDLPGVRRDDVHLELRENERQRRSGMQEEDLTLPVCSDIVVAGR